MSASCLAVRRAAKMVTEREAREADAKIRTAVTEQASFFLAVPLAGQHFPPVPDLGRGFRHPSWPRDHDRSHPT